MNTVYQGALAPEALIQNITPGLSGVDLSTVTAATFKVKKPDGTIYSWAATRSNQTATTLTLTYVFQSAADTAQLGSHVAVAFLTVPAGVVRTIPQNYTVVDQYAG